MWGVSGTGSGAGWRRWRIPRPTPKLAVLQVSISALDWLLTGAVLYAFMPQHAGPRVGLVLGAYMVAQVVGVTSHVPAGAGIFEVVVVTMLLRVDPLATRPGLAAALLMFRLMYYVLPLGVALVLAVLTEINLGRKHALTRDPGVLPTGAFEHAG